MKRWISKDAVIGKVGIALVILMIIMGISGSLRRPNPRNAEITPASNKTPAVTAATFSEKPKTAVTETRIETTEEVVPFDTVQTYDGTLAKDTTVVRVEGAAGKKVVKNEVKIKDGVEISRALISETLTVPPVSKVVAIGTKTVSKKQAEADTTCDQRYVPCVKKSSDNISCKDIGHQVKVVDPEDDPLQLDWDKDGIGCDNYPQL